MWLAIAIIGAFVIGIFSWHLRQQGSNRRSRWAWWREFHERMRRYPTSQEVDDWINEQTGPTAP